MDSWTLFNPKCWLNLIQRYWMQHFRSRVNNMLNSAVVARSLAFNIVRHFFCSGVRLDFQKSPSSDFIWRGTTSRDFVARGRPLRGQTMLAPLAKRSLRSPIFFLFDPVFYLLPSLLETKRERGGFLPSLFPSHDSLASFSCSIFFGPLNDWSRCLWPQE